MNFRNLVPLLVCCAATVALAQEVAPAGRSSASTMGRMPERGRFIIDLDPREVFVSLGVLAEADLIVDGTVLSGFAVNHNPEQHSAIETESRIAVNSVLKGLIRDEQRFLIVTQPGGRFGELEIVAKHCQIVEPGRRYILFLHRDRREGRPNETGLTRYQIVGIWAGLVRVESDKVYFAEGAHDTLHKNDGTPVGDFLRLIDDHIHHRVMPDPSERPKAPNLLPPPDVPSRP